MKKFKNLSIKRKVLVIGGLILIVGALATNNTETTGTESSKVQESTTQVTGSPVKPEETEKPEPTPELEINHEKVFKDTVQEIMKEAEVSAIENGSEITITSMMKENLTDKLVLGGYKQDVYDVVKALQKNEFMGEYDQICFIGNFNGVNKYGEEVIAKGVILTLKVEDINRINFDNVYRDDLFSFDKNLFIHNIFN